MGTSIAGVSEDPSLGHLPDGGSALGHWLREQRQLRGISVFFVAARTKIPAERITSIEAGRTALRDDVHGRGIARQLAAAVGADPDQAVGHLRPSGPAPEPPAPPAPRRQLRRWGLRVLSLSLILAALWATARLAERAIAGEPPAVVYRTDYVDELLEPPPHPGAP